MARDYKPRTQEKKRWNSRSDQRRNSSFHLWKWMLLTAVIILIVVGLVYLLTITFKKDNKSQAPIVVEKVTEAKPEVNMGPKIPQFDFYTILPDKEVVVPDYEIKTRAREERVGKAKETQYIMQAGSFKTFKDAEQLHLKLAKMGIESKIDKSKLGDINWYRVKIGPYTQTESVNTLRSRLRQNGIDILITEQDQ